MGYYRKTGIRFREGIFLFSTATEDHPAQWVKVPFSGFKGV
jgi:hypothetical protein